MRNVDIIRMAARNLRRRLSRTILTVISVIIGATSIIVMLSLGFGFTRQMEQSMQGAGSLTDIRVNPTNFYDPTSQGPVPTTGVLTKRVIDDIRAIDHVKSVLPMRQVQGSLRLKGTKYEVWTSLVAIDLNDFPEGSVPMLSGSFLSDTDKFGFIVGQHVGVMKVINPRRGDYEPVEDFDWSKAKPIMELGYRDEGAAAMGTATGRTFEEVPMKYLGTFQDNNLLRPETIYVSMHTADLLDKKNAELQANMQGGAGPVRKNKKKEVFYTDAVVTVDDFNNVEAVRKQIEDMELSAYSNMDFIKSMQDVARNTQLLLGGIGSIALLVAAIGISNTMLMSIYERTKEIGVMKVIGARVSDIRRLFLFEAMLIGVIGGLIGVGVSYGLSALINNLTAGMLSGPEAQAGGISYIPPWLALASLFFSALVGLVAGYLPAKRATKLSAIEAIRTN